MARKVWLLTPVVMPADFAPLNHRVGVGLGQGVVGELAGGATGGLEQERLRFAR